MTAKVEAVRRFEGYLRRIWLLQYDEPAANDVLLRALPGSASLAAICKRASEAAAVTTRVKVGFNVLVVPLRPAPWLAVQTATLQHLSHLIGQVMTSRIADDPAVQDTNPKRAPSHAVARHAYWPQPRFRS